MMRSLRRATILLFAFAAISAPAFRSSARTLTIQSFDVHVTVYPDSTIDVTEILDVNFQGVWHGIYRNIPVEYTGSMGLSYTLFLEPQSITDADGHALKYERSEER